MHYENGDEAKLGDLVIVSLKPGFLGDEVIGVLVAGTPQATACNGGMAALLKRTRSAIGTSPWQKWDNGGHNYSFTVGQANKLVEAPTISKDTAREEEVGQPVHA